MALILSPLIGFGLAAGLLLITKIVIPSKALYEPPKGDAPPPLWIRALLIGTCTGVSFAPGSNDGQKGMGLMLVLIGIVPATYALQMGTSSAEISATIKAAQDLEKELAEPSLAMLMTALREQHRAANKVERLTRSEGVAAAAAIESEMTDTIFDPFPKNDIVLATLEPLVLVRAVTSSLEGRQSFKDLNADERWKLRTNLSGTRRIGANAGATIWRPHGTRSNKDAEKPRWTTLQAG